MTDECTSVHDGRRRVVLWIAAGYLALFVLFLVGLLTDRTWTTWVLTVGWGLLTASWLWRWWRSGASA